ncbi:hypothetical protein GGR56DRAFT_675430 [Xylariaceae sp. FL0804]|nr:hypothetical protein GGR56DRAFT_675430 [Xylariaceae sp. FL0804]
MDQDDMHTTSGQDMVGLKRVLVCDMAPDLIIVAHDDAATAGEDSERTFLVSYQRLIEAIPGLKDMLGDKLQGATTDTGSQSFATIDTGDARPATVHISLRYLDAYEILFGLAHGSPIDLESMTVQKLAHLVLTCNACKLHGLVAKSMEAMYQAEWLVVAHEFGVPQLYSRLLEHLSCIVFSPFVNRNYLQSEIPPGLDAGICHIRKLCTAARIRGLQSWGMAATEALHAPPRTPLLLQLHELCAQSSITCVSAQRDALDAWFANAGLSHPFVPGPAISATAAAAPSSCGSVSEERERELFSPVHVFVPHDIDLSGHPGICSATCRSEGRLARIVNELRCITTTVGSDWAHEFFCRTGLNPTSPDAEMYMAACRDAWMQAGCASIDSDGGGERSVAAPGEDV